MIFGICNPTFDVEKDVGIGVCVSSFFCYNERMHKKKVKLNPFFEKYLIAILKNQDKN